MGSDSKWFRRTGVQIESGDTIIVPLDADRIRPLALWTSISAILYQLGLAAAAATAIGVF
jgi:polysaccharide export outer membrane protein